MKQIIDQATWVRRDHFAFFSRFEEPFFGVTIAIDCTEAYAYAKAEGHSFFLLYLYRALRAANSIPEFRYRIADDDVVLFDEVHASPTINRPDGSFGFAYMDYHKDETVFRAAARAKRGGARTTGSGAGAGYSRAGHDSFFRHSLARLYGPVACAQLQFSRQLPQDQFRQDDGAGGAQNHAGVRTRTSWPDGWLSYRLICRPVSAVYDPARAVVTCRRRG